MKKPKQKRTLWWILALVLCFAACGQRRQPAEPSAPTAAAAEETMTAGTARQPAATAAPTPTSVPAPTPTPPPTPTPVPTPASTFAVHFLDVGQADSALVLCDGASMLIDGGGIGDSDLMYAFLKENEVTQLTYIVCTHPETDHAGGLAGALNYARAETALCSVADADNEAFRNFKKYLDEQGVAVTVPAAGDTFALGSAAVQVLGPIEPDPEDANNSSLVLQIEYGDTSFLFTGDAESREEEQILAAGYPLQSTVLKVGHHGGADATSEAFLRAVMPSYAIISAGTGNAYGHPAQQTLTRLQEVGAEVLRTDLQGTITCKSDGRNAAFTADRDAATDPYAAPTPKPTPTPTPAPTPAPTPTPTPTEPPQPVVAPVVPAPEPPAVQTPVSSDYILNSNTGKFHYPYCKSVKQMKEKNKVYYTGTRDAVLAMGYVPCKNCNP